MNTNSNTYTIAYASIMVLVVSFLLAFVSSALKPTQDKNVELDKKKQILAALNIRDLAGTEAVEQKYDEVVNADMIINAKGDTLNAGADKDQAGFRVETKDISAESLPLYVCKVGDDVKYVVPVSGRGLWGGPGATWPSMPTARPSSAHTSPTKAKRPASARSSQSRSSRTSSKASRCLPTVPQPAWR